MYKSKVRHRCQDVQDVICWCESLGAGYLVPRRYEPGFVQRKGQENRIFPSGVFKSIFEINNMTKNVINQKVLGFFRFFVMGHNF